MKSLFASLVLCSALLAQAPATSKGTASKTGTPAARPSLLNPASLHAKAPGSIQGAVHDHQGGFCYRSASRLGAAGRGPVLQPGEERLLHKRGLLPGGEGFMVQFGLSANPAVNKAWENAKIQGRSGEGEQQARNLVFATGWPNTRTTQLFINFRRQHRSGRPGLRSDSA
jgi:hypothetical protein